MYIYNVTNKVSWAIKDQWIHWMKTVHIPEVMATGCFTESRLLHLLENDDEEGATYAAQYMTATREQYERYSSSFAPALRQDALNRWGNQFIAFRTLMQVVH